MFQSTPPRGGRQEQWPAGTRQERFQSTPPRGGRPYYPAMVNAGIMFQSTPPRGGRRPREMTTWHTTAVSIHAPARGATCGFPLKQCLAHVSIHAPARGATRQTRVRKHWGGVSIHAPARGATDVVARPGPEPVVSIHAPARGATYRDIQGLTDTGFQSTPPRGGRLGRWSRIASLPLGFNPRPRAGGDNGGGYLRGELRVSIHAPARGATVGARKRTPWRRGFNPRPRAGGD